MKTMLLLALVMVGCAESGASEMSRVPLSRRASPQPAADNSVEAMERDQAAQQPKPRQQIRARRTDDRASARAVSNAISRVGQDLQGPPVVHCVPDQLSLTPGAMKCQ